MAARRSAWNPDWRRILHDIYRCRGRIPLSCESTGTLKEGKARFLRAGPGSNIEFRRIRMAMVFCQGCQSEEDLNLVEDPGGESLASADLVFDHIVGITTWESCPDVRAVVTKLRLVRRKQVRIVGKTSSQSIREYMRNAIRPSNGVPRQRLRRASKRPLTIEKRPNDDRPGADTVRAATAMSMAMDSHAPAHYGSNGLNGGSESPSVNGGPHHEDAQFGGPNSNPYLDQFLSAASRWPPGTHDLQRAEPRLSAQRADCIRALAADAAVMQRHFSYAIPDERVLHLLSAFSPLLELGARSAYWRYMLRRRGAHVTASAEGYGVGEHDLHNAARVKAMQAAAFANHSHTLLVYHSEAVGDVRTELLDLFRGAFVICVGEVEVDAETQTLHYDASEFAEALTRNFAFAKAVPLRYRWPHARDSVTLWMRRVPGAPVGAKLPPLPEFVRHALAEGDVRLNADELRRGFCGRIPSSAAQS